jgi:hypothetical protein
MLFCDNCGSKKEEGSKFCSECGKPYSQTPAVSSSISSSGVQGHGYWQTWTLASTDPSALYPLLGDPKKNGEAVKFFLLTQLISALIFALLTMIGHLGIAFGPLGVISIPFIFLGTAIYMAFAWIGLYISVWLFNLFLSLVGGASRGYSATFQTVAYASAPGIIPIIGGFWGLIMLVIGASQAHRTEIWRPIIAVILEVVAITFLIMFIFGMAWLFFVIVHHL